LDELIKIRRQVPHCTPEAQEPWTRAAMPPCPQRCNGESKSLGNLRLGEWRYRTRFLDPVIITHGRSVHDQAPEHQRSNTPTCCPECRARQRAGDVAGTLDVVALMWAVCRHRSPEAFGLRSGDFRVSHHR
jgi:hypothetical protein